MGRDAAGRVPPIASPGELAELLSSTPAQLAWLADARGLERDTPDRRLRHYTLPLAAAPGGPPRPIARPKRRLKEIQRWILHEILDRIPPHDAAHGFVRGRSARTPCRAPRRPGHRRAARPRGLLRLGARRRGSTAIFRTAGYPEAVAHTLTALCVTVVPRAEWAPCRAPTTRAYGRHHRLGRRLATPHLPQGAPTSPALASLAATGLDRRLAALAPTLARRLLALRRRPDVLRRPPASPPGRCAGGRATIARDEGFRVAPAQDGRAPPQRAPARVRRRRQRAAQRPPAEYDRLKAILHDAARHGAGGRQPRRRRRTSARTCSGRIAWVALSCTAARGGSCRSASTRSSGDAVHPSGRWSRRARSERVGTPHAPHR